MFKISTCPSDIYIDFTQKIILFTDPFCITDMKKTQNWKDERSDWSAASSENPLTHWKAFLCLFFPLLCVFSVTSLSLKSSETHSGPVSIGQRSCITGAVHDITLIYGKHRVWGWAVVTPVMFCFVWIIFTAVFVSSTKWKNNKNEKKLLLQSGNVFFFLNSIKTHIAMKLLGSFHWFE